MTEGRVAVVLTPALQARGGAERVALVTASTLRDLGYRTYLAGPGDVDDLPGIGRYLGVDVKELSYVPLQSVGTVGRFEAFRTIVEERRWSRQISTLHPDVFVNCLFGTTLLGQAPTSLYYAHFPHSLGVPSATGLRKLYVRTARVALSLLNGGRDFRTSYSVFLANSAFTAHHVERLWNVNAEVLYPPCRLIGQGSASRRRRILAVGRFQDRVPGRPHKRQDALIAAFSSLRELHDAGWELHLAGSVGSGAEADRLMAAASGLPVVMHLDVPRQELIELYRTSSVYWHAQGFEEPVDTQPQAHEHFGITTVEALSAGLVAMVHDEAGPAEIVEGVPGTVCWGTVDELRAATGKLADSPDDAVHSWRVAAERRAHDFDEETFRSRLATILDRSAHEDE